MNKQLRAANAATCEQSTSAQYGTTSRSVSGFLKTLIVLLALIWAPQFINAQTVGQYVTIKHAGSNNYLSTNSSNGLVTSASPTAYSLWLLGGSAGSYTFQNPITGGYVYHANANSSLSISASSATWVMSGGRIYYTRNSNNYYISCRNNSWSASNTTTTSRIDLTITGYTAQGNLTYSGATTINFAAASEAKSIQLDNYPHVTIGSETIPLYKVAISNSNFTASVDKGVVSITSTTNTSSSPRSATMTITHGTSTITIHLAQAAASFSHQKGHSGRDLQANGMQGVHTERYVVYLKQDESRTLSVPEETFGFSRWYNYANDNTLSSDFTISGYTAVVGNKGVYKRAANVGAGTYKNTSSQTTGVVAEVACDMSNYVDYTISNSILLKEPTLSQRVIFEIRPAAEMAAKLDAHVNTNGAVNGSYLENYEITAPVGKVVRIGTEYAFTGSGNNYYYGSAVTKISSPSWRKDGVSYSATIQNNRVLYLPAETNAKTVVYTLVSNNRGIAKFTVNYKSQDEVGPRQTAIVSEADFQNSYKYVTGLRFDGDKNIPLEWDESGYGFYYQDWGTNSTYRNSAHPGVYWGEYTLMNMVPSEGYTFLVQGVRDMKHQNSGATDGNFFYVDASNTPGVVADLKFKDGGLCSGTRMYVSAWVNNLGTGTKPNLNFSVVGINNGSETVISTFTTGDLDEGSARGKWHQIFFELTMPETDYADYRLRVVNNAQNAAGNDFAIDDICVYMQKPALMTYQASVTCSNVADETVVMLRIDPDGLDAIPTNGNVKTIYYHMMENGGSVLNMRDYYGVSNNHGMLSHNVRTLAYPVIDADAVNNMTALEVYMDRKIQDPNYSNAFYAREQDEKGVWKTILYVYHSDNQFEVGKTYTCVIAANAENLEDNAASCGLTSDFTIQPKAKLIINNRPGGSLVTEGMCANQYNSLKLEMFGSNSGLTETFGGSCKADWLEGREEDYKAMGMYATYNYQVVCNAIMAFRAANQTSTDVSTSVLGSGYTQAQKDLLIELVSRGMLELYKEEVFRRTLSGTTYYTAFPISSTAKGADGADMDICEMPVVIALSAIESNPGFIVREIAEQGAPAEVYELSRVIRMSQVEAMHSMLEMPVVLQNGLTIEQLRNSDVFLLPTTTDKRSTLPFDNNTVANKVFGTVSAANNSGQLVLSLSGRDSRMDFQQGHRYDFIVVSTVAGEECQGAGRFSIVVVPDMVMWSPKEESNSWHVDRNWDMIDAQGNVLSTGNGYAPAAHTNVMVNAGSAIPVLEAATAATVSRSALTLADDAQDMIEWDLRFVANTCKNIHLGAKAMFAGQDNLTYEKAWVDVALRTNEWNLIAPPFEDMVVGDMYIPSNGDQTPLFTDVASPDSRRVYEFWTSLYNSTGVEKDRYNQTTSISSSEWTTPFNALNTAIVPAHGYSVKVEDHTANAAEEVVVRLPKRDEVYYYYGSYGEQTNLKENITRTDNGHRLAGTNGSKTNQAVFTTDVIYSQTVNQHLMANPYMAELDMLAFVSDSYNNRTCSGRYAIMDSGRVQTIIDLNNQVTNGGAMTGEYVIAPMTSFMVYLSGMSNPQLQVTPSMLKSYKKGASSAAPAYAPMMDSRRILSIKGVRNGVTSHCTILEKYDANNGLDEEDTHLMLINSNLTPSGIYTNVENTALAINITSDIHMTPLGFAVIDDSSTESLDITFTGVDNFPGELSLYDAATRKTIALTEGMTLSLPNLAGGTRYYIYYQPEATDAVEELTQDGNLKVYQPQRGEVVLACSDVMTRVRVYNVNGQLIEDRAMLNSSLENFSLPTGVYVFDVESANGVYREKSIVR